MSLDSSIFLASIGRKGLTMLLSLFILVQALDSSVTGVTSIKEEGGRSSAAIDDSVFEIPRGKEMQILPDVCVI